MKASDIVITVGALAGLGVVGYLGYKFISNLNLTSEKGKVQDYQSEQSDTPGSSAVPIVITAGGDVNKVTGAPASNMTTISDANGNIIGTTPVPADIVKANISTACLKGWYKTAQQAQLAWSAEHGTVSGTYRYEYDNTGCVRVTSVVTTNPFDSTAAQTITATLSADRRAIWYINGNYVGATDGTTLTRKVERGSGFVVKVESRDEYSVNATKSFPANADMTIRYVGGVLG
jgi:hypothetical protein